MFSCLEKVSEDFFHGQVAAVLPPESPTMAAPPESPCCIDPGRRAVLTVRGPDALRFCDNFVTASLARLPSGAGTEAFVLDVKGGVIAHIHAFRLPDGVWIDAEGGLDSGARLASHFGHYHIREQLELVDHSDAFRHVVVCGFREAGRDLDWLDSIEGTLRARLPWMPEEGMLIAVPTGRFEEVMQRLVAAGVPREGPDAWTRLRVTSRVPSTEDLSDRTLPQELGRDSEAIAFDKGCYLGQETVARLDALGHVNRRLVLLSVAGSTVPATGAACLLDGRPVGVVGSACSAEGAGSGDAEGSWALAMLSVAAADAADGLSVEGRRARVLPADGA
jgi:folate-binding protein YgfZ